MILSASGDDPDDRPGPEWERDWFATDTIFKDNDARRRWVRSQYDRALWENAS